MKKFLMASLVVATFFASISGFAQDQKSAGPSPPDTALVVRGAGDTIKIMYSQPSVKGRTIGNEIAPYGKVWRTGANEATVFQITKDAKIEGKYPLAAGKYGLYSLPGGKKWTIIFNKTWNQWGTKYTEADDALRVEVDTQKAPEFTEKMTFKVSNDGKVTLTWGDKLVSFSVQ